MFQKFAFICGLAVLTIIVAPLSISSAQSCSYAMFRASDDSLEGGQAVGVRADLYIPESYEVSGYGSTNDHQSIGDIAMLDPGGSGFVQFGWYVGHADQLPYVSTPHIFIGENHDGAQNGEVLRTYGALSWNSSHNFTIVPDGNSFNFYESGNGIDQSLYQHSSVSDAYFVGEVDYNGVSMYAEASKPDQPYETLQWQGSGGAYHFFSNDYRKASSGFYSDADPSGATDLAFGGGNCS